MGQVKETNIKNQSYYFFDDIIDIRNFHSNHGGTDCYEKCAATAQSCCLSSVLASVKIFE